MHHVRPAEALRILKRRDIDGVARLQVNEIHGDGRSADIGRDAIDCAGVPPQVARTVRPDMYDRFAAAPYCGLQFNIALDAVSQDARLASEDAELQVRVWIVDARLACQPIVTAQETLSSSRRR